MTKSGRRTAKYTWPVIIPPVHSKEALIRQFIPEVWIDADRSLRTAERLIFIGYSLPRLDVSAERLFRRAIAANIQLGRVDVINPDTSAALRFASVCSPTPLCWYRSIESFLREDGFA